MIGFVAGFGRCGTSLTMAMLQAGGLPVSGSETVFENAGFSPVRTEVRWLNSQHGRIVKWVCPLSTWCPGEIEARTLWLERDPQEQARSQVKLALAFGEPITNPSAAVKACEDHIRTRTEAAVASAACHGPVTRLSFEQLLSDPAGSARGLARFFRDFGRLDVARAAAVVKPRSPACASGLEVDLDDIRQELLPHA